ncbi:MAG: hypothetical protein QOI41_1276 [Myxococcales bacterium]|jgi:hypothetical protein|nr:hypothetical protein [Myxococcales bacterium]
MKDVTVRWVQTIGTTALFGTLLATSTGCGAIAAAANPKVAWAISDPAPMSVVVRRADVAEKTAVQVDRVMTDTPANDDSAWLATVGPQKDDATKTLADLRQHQLYAAGGPGAGARIVPAEVWAKSLASIEPKAVAGAKAAPAAPAPAAAPAVAAPEADAAAEPVAKSAEPAVKNGKGKGGKKKPGTIAKNEPKPNKKGSKNAPLADKAAAPPADATPAPAPAPVATVTVAQPVASKYPSLLAAINPDLGTAWAEIMEQKKALGELKAQIAAEETALDEKGISDADKKAHKKTIEGLEKQSDKIEKKADKLTDAFVPKVKEAAKKAPADVRDRFGAVLVNLRQAVDDAKIANGAAAVRYPMAATSLIDSAKQMASVYTADVVEEKTGKRPNTAGLQPGVTMEGGKVAITLNGLSQADLGKTTIGDVTSEVAARTTKWVGRALGLLGTISATSDTLSFEKDVLDGLIDGFTASGWKAPAAATIPDSPVAGAPGAQSAPKS